MLVFISFQPCNSQLTPPLIVYLHKTSNLPTSGLTFVDLRSSQYNKPASFSPLRIIFIAPTRRGAIPEKKQLQIKFITGQKIKIFTPAFPPWTSWYLTRPLNDKRGRLFKIPPLAHTLIQPGAPLLAERRRKNKGRARVDCRIMRTCRRGTMSEL